MPLDPSFDITELCTLDIPVSQIIQILSVSLSDEGKEWCAHAGTNARYCQAL